MKKQAIDFKTEDTTVSDDFDKTEEYKWLQKNAQNFNFFESYPKNNDLDMMYEPWHWRHETGTGSMTKEEAMLHLEEQITTNKPDYSPRNETAKARMSIVASATENLIRTASRLENQGVGDQIRTIAQTQTQNQDRINQSIDAADKRTKFAKFFIGANYKELKNAEKLLTENQNQIKELQQTMDTLGDADKIAVANQIIVLQQEQIQLQEQINDMAKVFSLFGWINRWWNKY